MKKVLSLLIGVFLISYLFFCTITLAESIDIDSLSGEDLLLLQEKIKDKLLQADTEVLQESKSKDRIIEILNTDNVIYVGKTLKLQTAITRLNDTAIKSTRLLWSSDNPDIATVTKDGIIQAISTGQTEIHVCASDNQTISSSFEIIVRASAKTIGLSDADISLLLGGEENTDKATIKASVLPEEAFDKSLSYSSSNTRIVEVDSNGNLQAISAGKAVVTVKSEDKSLSSVVSAKCRITVNQAITSISVNEKTIKIGVGKRATIKAEVSPSSATHKRLNYISSDESIATVTANGIVTGIAPGSCKVTVKATDGSNAEEYCDIVVNKLATGLKTNVSNNQIYLVEGQETKVEYSVLPDDASDKSIHWSSSKYQVVDIYPDENFITLKGKKEGFATITGTTKDGSNKKITLRVQVEPYYSLKCVKCYGYEEWGFHSYVYVLKNVSNTRTIDGITVTYQANDVYDNPLRAHGFGDLIVRETINITIKPGQTKRTKAIHTYGFDNAKHLYINIAQIHFTDGTTAYINFGINEFYRHFTW